MSEGGGCADLVLRGSSTKDTNLEVISTLAAGSSAHARPSVGLQPGQASLGSLVLPTSPARRLESSLNGRPSGHKRGLRRIPGMEPNLASRAGRATARDSPPDPCCASRVTGHGGFFSFLVSFLTKHNLKKNSKNRVGGRVTWCRSLGDKFLLPCLNIACICAVWPYIPTYRIISPKFAQDGAYRGVHTSPVGNCNLLEPAE